MAGLTDEQQTRLGTAALFAGLAVALERSGQIRAEDLEGEFLRMYSHLRQVESPSTGAMEMVTWARELFRVLKEDPGA